MSQQLFTYNPSGCQVLAAWQPMDERQVQRFFEANLEKLLGLHFIASEWEMDQGLLRVDTLAIDRDGTPTIVEFKKGVENGLLSQILCYKSALVRHKSEYELAGKSRFGNQFRPNWSGVRIVCIAQDFSRYDVDALDSVNGNVDLVKFQFFGQENVLLDTIKSTRQAVKTKPETKRSRSFQEQLSIASEAVKELYARVSTLVATMDDLYASESSTGVLLSSLTSELARITLTQGLHPRLKVTVNGEPPSEIAAGFSSMRQGKGSTEITLRHLSEIDSICAWLELEKNSAMMAL